MDASVLDAMARWPNVPAVYGWLSLDARGAWRLHPGGGAAHGEPGEGISNAQILAYIGRNYASDGHGQWFFQNGPQRVYVQLELAPLVIRLADDGVSLQTHHGLPVERLDAWWLSDEGSLFLQCEHGPGVILDRDLAALLDQLRTERGETLANLLAKASPSLPAGAIIKTRGTTPAGLQTIGQQQIPEALGFVRCPQPPAQSTLPD